ncbi:MAG: Ig-like domain-containing protein [Armatimonadota bacterium]
MERLGSLFWSGVTMVALLGMVSSVAAPIALASPIVKITQPEHEQVVRGEFVIDVSYRSDSDQPITRIDLLIDDEVVSQYALNSPRVSGTQSFKWTLNSGAGSKHTISASAVDAAGEVGRATITVTVAAAESRTPAGPDRVPPVINIYYPADGAEVSGEVEIKAEASDDNGVMAVFFYLDGKFHTAIMNTGPYTARWDTEKMSDGPHVLQARVMDHAENESASAEVTVFVQNRDMTAATPEGLAPQATSTPQIPAPAVGAGDQPVTHSEFATPSEPTMAMAARGVDPVGARVGYVPAIGAETPGARVSAPRMLSALPHSLESQPAHELAAQESSLEALAVATTREPIDQQMIATTDLMPRMTVPRTLAETDSHVVEPMAPAQRTAAPVDPQIAAVDSLQRMTLPRTEVERLPSTDTGVEMRPGMVELDPILQLTPERELAAARTTMPGMGLLHTEPLAADETGTQTLLVSSEPQTEFGSVVARLDSRITMPDRALGTPTVTDRVPTDLEPTDLTAFEPVEGDTSAMRIAVLPERASRAAIPADGRITRPDEPAIAPVASMEFDQVKVLFDNETLELLAEPEFADGISMAPLREIFEHSDGSLYWFPVEKRVKATRPGTEMDLTIGDADVQINDETRTLQIAPYIKQGRTMVPLQFLADTLDVTVTLNPETGQILLTSNEF